MNICCMSLLLADNTGDDDDDGDDYDVLTGGSQDRHHAYNASVFRGMSC